MISQKVQQRIYDALLAEYSPEVAKAFVKAITDAKTAVNLNDLIELIERNDVYGIVQLLEIDERTLFPVSEVMRDGFIAAGQSSADFIPSQAVFGFNGRTPRAEQLLKEQSGRMITQLSEDVLPVVQETLSAARERGQGSRKTALDLIGRREKGSKVRKGGIIGLNLPQSRAVDNMREQLRNLDKGYFGKVLRDKRFDKTVAKAIETGKPLTESQISRIVDRYKDKQLQYRARNIAQYETNAALTQGQFEGFKQLIDAGKLDGLEKTWNWNKGGQKEPRPHHQEMSGTKKNWDEDFVFPDGTRMSHPHDERGGPKENSFCRCTVFYRPIIEVD